jgi:C4-dicarboxylate transporter, DctM subunit
MLVKVLSKTERICAIISGAFILIMTLLTTADVFMRYVFNRPINGNFELQPMLLIGVVYLATASVQARKGHISLDLITSHVSGATQSALNLFGDIIFLIFTALITWQFGVATWKAWVIGDYFKGLVHLPLWPPYLIITFGSALLSLRLIEGIVNNQLWRKNSGVSASGRYLRMALIVVVLVLLLAGIFAALNANLHPQTVGWIAIGLFLLFMALGTPVTACMGLVTLIGFWLLRGGTAALGIAANIPFSAVGQYSMTVMPLFLIMGSLAALAGFAEEGFNLAKRWLEPIPGGIIHATVIGATAFGAASGSGAATVAVLTKVAIPEMLKQGVKKGMAIGVVASAATLDIMIPPSTTFVMYAMMTGNSVGQLLMAGVIPGLIGALIIMGMVAIRCWLDPSQSGQSSPIRTPWKKRITSIPRAWGILFIAVVVMGGLYSGIFTPTEAGSIGAFAALAAGLVLRKANLKNIGEILLESGGLTATILFILLAGTMFSYIMALTKLPAGFAEWVVGLNLPPIAIIVVIMFIYFLLGTALDDITVMIATLPIIYPIIIKLGFSPIWFGVLMVQNIEIGVISPPYGVNLFIMKGMLKDTTMTEIFRSVIWFIVPLVVTMAVYIAFPQVALWLPNMMMK